MPSVRLLWTRFTVQRVARRHSGRSSDRPTCCAHGPPQRRPRSPCPRPRRLSSSKSGRNPPDFRRCSDSHPPGGSSGRAVSTVTSTPPCALRAVISTGFIRRRWRRIRALSAARACGVRISLLEQQHRAQEVLSADDVDRVGPSIGHGRSPSLCGVKDVIPLEVNRDDREAIEILRAFGVAARQENERAEGQRGKNRHPHRSTCGCDPAFRIRCVVPPLQGERRHASGNPSRPTKSAGNSRIP